MGRRLWGRQVQGICANPKKRPSVNGGVAFTGIITLLIGGAWATATAVGSPTSFWPVWISLLPLFAAIRLFSAKSSAFFGGFWGGCLYLFLAASPAMMTESGAPILAMLVIIPAAYAAVMAVFSRRFGYSPLAMALGWILVELAFNLAGLRDGLLSVGNSRGPALQIVADFLGSGFVAFIIVWISAFLLFIPLKMALPYVMRLLEHEDCNPTRIPIHKTLCPLSITVVGRPSPRAPPVAVDCAIP